MNKPTPTSDQQQKQEPVKISIDNPSSKYNLEYWPVISTNEKDSKATTHTFNNKKINNEEDNKNKE